MKTAIFSAILASLVSTASLADDLDYSQHKFAKISKFSKSPPVEAFMNTIRSQFNDPESVRLESDIILAAKPGMPEMEMCAMVNAKNAFGGYPGANLVWVKIEENTIIAEIGRNGNAKIFSHCNAISSAVQVPGASLTTVE